MNASSDWFLFKIKIGEDEVVSKVWNVPCSKCESWDAMFYNFPYYKFEGNCCIEFVIFNIQYIQLGGGTTYFNILTIMDIE